MRKTTYLLLVLCLLVPVTASAAQSSGQPTLDCKSAVPPKMDFKTFDDTCRTMAAAERARSSELRTEAATGGAAAAVAVYDSRTTVAGLSFANVPTWSDSDILAQFPTTRDKRYMTTSDNPSFQRRISWMFPEDGCFSRAEQLDVQAAQAGKTRPYKLYAFGRNPLLRVYTNNTSSGMVNWWYHVVPVVKNSAGEPIVFDAALSPCKPLPWKKWLAMMVGDMALYDNVAAGNGVALGDSWSYNPYSLVSGEPSHSAESLTDQTGAYLPAEWNRQIELGRDPNVVLGASPPWGGYNCVMTEVELSTLAVPSNTSATVSTRCPFATVAVGGGLQLSGQNFAVSKNAMNGNAWEVTARNNSGSSQQLSASAVCLTGAPSNASISTIMGNVVNINANSYNTSTASCGIATLVGGGFVTTLGQNPSSVMRIYTNGRTSTGNAWQVSAYNTTTTAKTITAYAYCLLNTNFTFSQSSGNLSAGGIASASCTNPKHTMGGGFVFPRTTAYTVMNMQNFGSKYDVDMTPAPVAGDANAKAYAECLTHP